MNPVSLPVQAGALASLPVGPDPALLVAVGGALGATLRHWVYLHVAGDGFPWPTLAVNVLGSLALGLLVFGEPPASALTLLGTGTCGAFTTFSTFSVETVDRWERGERALAVTNAAANLLASLAAVGVAWAIAGGF